MRKHIITWWKNLSAWWNWKKTIDVKDKEIILLRTQVSELVEKNLSLEMRVDKLLRDIVQMAENIEKERIEQKKALEIQKVKYVLLERRMGR